MSYSGEKEEEEDKNKRERTASVQLHAQRRSFIDEEIEMQTLGESAEDETKKSEEKRGFG